MSSFREARAHIRYSFDALGFLQIGEERLGIQTLDVSRNGAGLRIGAEGWAAIEDMEDIQGQLNLGGQPFPFKARVCWSAGEPETDDGKPHVRFGIAFTEWDPIIVEAMLESMAIEDDEPGDTFNL